MEFRNLISIHAPREGGDGNVRGFPDIKGDFNPRPPRGGRPVAGAVAVTYRHFNPRPPRGGRPPWPAPTGTPASRNFNPRPPRGGRPEPHHDGGVGVTFQSTPPARGATGHVGVVGLETDDFNPRPPRGGRPSAGGADPGAERISIHAPREGGDPHCSAIALAMPDFNPRPPRGGRRRSRSRSLQTFQSTPPARGATPYTDNRRILSAISIHAPREGGDGFFYE